MTDSRKRLGDFIQQGAGSKLLAAFFDGKMESEVKNMTTPKNIKIPLMIVLIDLMDAYYYADVFDEERYTAIRQKYSDYDIACGLTDRLFWALNPNDKTREKWVTRDAGWDVRIYDADYKCVYKAHEKLPAK